MLKRRILLWKTTEGQALGLGLDLFDFILNSPPLTRDVTWSRLYFKGKKNTRRKCQMNTLYQYAINRWFYSYTTILNHIYFISFMVFLSYYGFRDFLFKISWIREQGTSLFKNTLLNSYSRYQAHFVKF